MTGSWCQAVFARCFALLAAAAVANAHPQPSTLILFDAGSSGVTAELHVPLPELELAFGHGVTRRPLTEWEQPFRSYLLAHFRLATSSGDFWSAQVIRAELVNSEQSQTGSFPEIVTHLALTPPPGASPRDFVLLHDLILHQVVTHKALVSIRTNWQAGQVEPTAVGAIFVDTANGRIQPLRIQAKTGSWLLGFRAMLTLGAEHIREGLDHLLFLTVLLLPATLRIDGGRWGAFAGNARSLWRVVRFVTAFTLGHSLTLMAGALNWVRLPQRPVEVLIAFSVLLTAIHAIRPIFPGRESHLAGFFGLVHGLAFATALSNLRVDGAELALSLLGFHLGIELMQLLVIALILPWLLVLSMTPAHRLVRVGGAIAAAAVSIGWIASRISDQSNFIDRAAASATGLAPAAIVLLALIAILTHLRTAIRTTSAHGRNA